MPQLQDGTDDLFVLLTQQFGDLPAAPIVGHQ